ncbi:hypothetical protein SAMN04488565_2263 [Leucobacter chromiiresistens]|uniref:Uncharacterized protein n=1 Tax=Leucobacter chromiiresistens TaxID=1079994 RepID=A0A1H1A1U3_9MICO|nr:hypothetical protein SAMN04488565_2263 [Leucobacter chromiiresistens]
MIYSESNQTFGDLMRPLPRPLQALATWVAILPLVLGTSAAVEPFTTGWPDPVRTALVITIVVPVAVFAAVPILVRVIQRLRGTPATVIADACPAPGLGNPHDGSPQTCTANPPTPRSGTDGRGGSR